MSEQVLIQVHFPSTGPWGDEMAVAYKELAESIAKEPGFLWKIWTESKELGEAGGIYLFKDKESALKYIHMHEQRLKGFGVPVVHWRLFHVNETLSAIDNFKLTQ